jgi:hypothetical protein
MRLVRVEGKGAPEPERSRNGTRGNLLLLLLLLVKDAKTITTAKYELYD